MNVGTTLQPLHGKVTQRFISRKLDVSVSTVSRALNDNPLVNADTKKKILEIANQFNYSPNEVALSLKNRKTKRVGVVFGDDFPQERLMAIVKVVLANDHWPVLGTTKQVFELVRNGLDGLVILGEAILEHPLNLPHIALDEVGPLETHPLLSDLFDVLKEMEA